VKRGEVWTAAGAGPYGSKPRPVVIVQSDLLAPLESVLICPFTSDMTEAVFRPDVAPTPSNGLKTPSRLMADKLAAAPRAALGKQLGALSTADLEALERALVLVLGLGD
jgi:mRNA interferase MazF